MVDIDSKTEIMGLIGYPLSHSVSPLLHNTAFEKLELNCVYFPFEIESENLESALVGLKSLNLRGVNVTIPYKNDVIKYLDQIDEMAAQMGAVNTISHEDNKLIGYNTDLSGFQLMLEKDGEFKITGKKALIIGAGGASRAVGTVLCENNIDQLYIINRSPQKADILAEFWSENYPTVKIESAALEQNFYNPLIEGVVDLVIDTTPVGMSPKQEQSPVIDVSKFHSDLLVVDLVYNPPETTILRAARKKGAETLNGLPMLLYQAADSFEIWTGERPPVEEWFKLFEK